MKTKTEWIGKTGYKIIQGDCHLKLGTDSILLAHFARCKHSDRVCDLGAGCGAISMILAANHDKITVDMIEIEPAAAQIANENIKLNSLDRRVFLHNKDLTRAKDFLPAAGFDAVVSNPPYMPKGSGKTRQTREQIVARTEECCTLEQLCQTAGYLLRFGGLFYVVYTPARLCDLFYEMRRAKIEPKRVRLVQNRLDSAPKIVLVEGMRGGNSGIKFENTLVLRDDEGNWREEMKGLLLGDM